MTREFAEAVVRAVLNEMSALSNYEVDLLLHGQYDDEGRADRFNAEDKLFEALQQVPLP